jgi:DNA-binding PadR family transcriptional regulator
VLSMMPDGRPGGLDSLIVMLEYSTMTTMRVATPPAISGNGEMTRVVLLGVLRNGPMHGYAIKQTLEGWYMDFWADVKLGSIYAGLKRLVAEGLIEETGTSRAGNRPVRTTYRITRAGREELRHLLRSFWTPPMRTARPVDLALQFVNELPIEEIEPLIEERLQALTNQQAIFRPEFRPAFDDPARQARVDDLHEHELRLLTAEREWCEYVLARLRSGAYDASGTRRGRRRTS